MNNSPAVKKILFLGFKPKNLQHIDLTEEINAIKQGINSSRYRNEAVEFSDFVNWPLEELLSTLLDFNPQIIHFSCHGTGLDGLKFTDKNGNDHDISTDVLTQLLTKHHSDINDIKYECVVLNACHSEIQANACVQYAEYAIGMREDINDKMAIGFSRYFYRALGNRQSIKEAYDFACRQLELLNVDGCKSPILITDNQQSSKYYVKRHSEKEFLKKIENEYLIRIRGAKFTGKTEFCNHVLQKLSTQQYQIVRLYLTKNSWENVDDESKFLKWFCEDIAKQLEVPYSWLQEFTPQEQCNNAFEKHFFTNIKNKILIIYFQNFHEIFDKNNLFEAISNLLRSWGAKQVDKDDSGWNRLRLILEYSTELYVTNNIIIASLLWSIGHVINLKDFNKQQVENLSEKFNLTKWKDDYLNQFMAFLNGHPYLVYHAFEELEKNKTQFDDEFENFLKNAATLEGIYSDFLNYYEKILEQNPELQEAFKKIIS